MIGFVLLVASAVLLAGGAELFAENAAAAGTRLGVSVLAVGLVLAGAEPEELVTAVFAAARHRTGIAVGDAVGANVTMLTLVLGLAILLRPLPFGRSIRLYAVTAAGAGAAAAVTLTDGRVSRVEGVILVAAYLGLLALVWWRERRPPAFGEAAEFAAVERGAGPGGGDDAATAGRSGGHDGGHDGGHGGGQGGSQASGSAAGPGAGSAAGSAAGPVGGAGGGPVGGPVGGAGGGPVGGAGGGAAQRPAVALGLVLAGIAAMAFGGWLAVVGAERVVSALHLADTAVGLTFVALATTAELFALVWAAARRGVEELAVAGVLGSAIYNATATLGVAALVRPLTSAGAVTPAWAAAVLPAVLLVSARRGKVPRAAGVVLICGYAVFVVLTLR